MTLPASVWGVRSTVPNTTAHGLVQVPEGGMGMWMDAEGNLWAGPCPPRRVGDISGSNESNIPGFLYLARADMLFLRGGLLLQDQGDPVDLVLGRAGGTPDGPTLGLTKGSNLGAIYWRGWDSPAEIGGQPGGSWAPRTAQISVKSAQDFVTRNGIRSHPGYMIFSTAPELYPSSDIPHRVIITDDGVLAVLGPGLSESRALITGNTGDFITGGNIGVRGRPPIPGSAVTVTGSRSQDRLSVMTQLLSVLSAQGLIVDKTTA